MEKKVFFHLVLISFCCLFSGHLYASSLLVTGDSVKLSEVVITPKSFGKLSYRTTVLQTQKIGAAELTRAACCNLSESFETNPSVDVAYSDAVTGAKQIRLLGLDGEYVQLLTENFPNFRGLATPYGLDYIPGPWMESIQVSKGTASVKNGFESITGQINVEYKKPAASDVLTANLFLADNLRLEANVDATARLNDKLSTGLFLHYSTEEKEMDANDDLFLDTPLKRQFNILNRWYYRSEKRISQTGVQYLHDSRDGGQTGKVKENRYRTGLDVNRFSFFTKNGLILDPEKNESTALIFSGSYHDQNSSFGRTVYDAEETNLYANLMYEREFTPMHKISTGLSLDYLKLNESDFPGYRPEPEETTGGAYLEYTLNKNHKLIVLAGLRVDYSSLHDLFVTPRLHLKYNFTDWLFLRGTAGKGYRTPHILAENNYLLAGSRQFVFEGKPTQEEAWNYGLNLGLYIPVDRKELVVNAEWYYSDFRNQMVTDLDTDPHAVLFYNLDGKSYSSVFQIEASYPFFRGFDLTAAWRWMDVKTDYKGISRKKPLTSNYKALLTASYRTALRKWQFDATCLLNGGGRLPTPDELNPMWEKSFSSYTIVHLQISRFFRSWSVYGGVENLLDFTQKERIISADNPWGDDFDATMVWGPVHGRKFYIGVRYHIPRF